MLDSPLKGSWRRIQSRRQILWVLGWSAAGCADVLGIPSDPRVADSSVAEASDSRRGYAAGEPPLAAPAASGEVVSPLSAEGVLPSALAPEPDGSVLQAGEGEGEAADAGGLAPDVGTAGDASSPPSCAASQTLGPNGRCLAVLEPLLAWSDARQSCRALGEGWDLASLRSEREGDFVAGLLAVEAWIGASDLEREGTWIWVDDGTAFWRGTAAEGSALNGAYVNWNSTEPNGAENSDCARVVPAVGYTWADLECESLLGAVCQGPPR